MTDLHTYSLLTVFLVGLGIVLIAADIGRRLGMRTGDTNDTQLGTLEAAVIGMLALMIGFTFSMALTRFDSRRDAVIDEANAIGHRGAARPPAPGPA